MAVMSEGEPGLPTLSLSAYVAFATRSHGRAIAMLVLVSLLAFLPGFFQIPPVDRDEARWLWKNASDAELQELAGMVRERFHAPGSCTYMVMRIINYTNVCVAQCDYCAFYKLPAQDGGYVLSH